MYKFRREDTGELVDVSFERMMEQVGGYLTLNLDGKEVSLRRIYEDNPVKKTSDIPTVDRPIVSDSLGFTSKQFAEFEADRVRHGFSGVEFKRDPGYRGFYQVHFQSKREWERYVKHRGMVDQNGSTRGNAMTPELLERSAEILLRQEKS